VSPLLGGWAAIVAVAGIWFYTASPDWMTGAPDNTDMDNGVTFPPWVWFVGAFVIALIAVGFSYLSWYYTQYRIGDDAVYQRRGVISRQQMQARLNRLQAVDVVQPLVARIFGFAKLRIEVAGGAGSGTEIAFLRLGDAEALRNEILLLAAGHQAPVAEDAQAVALAAQAAGTEGIAADAVVDSALSAPALSSPAAAGSSVGPSLRDVIRGMPDGVPATPAAASRHVYTVSTGRLVGSMLLSWPFVILLSLPLVVFAAILVWGSNVENVLRLIIGASVFTALPFVVGTLSYFWTQLSGGFGFEASISQDGIRLRHGLLETRRQTVPPGRVQAVQFKQSLLWRRKDWWRVTINVAGYQDEQAAVSTLLPVGTRQDALTALWLVLPDLGDPDPAGTISRAMSGIGDDGGFTASPRRSMIFDLLQWRHRGVRATDKALLIRRGLFLRELFVVPHERTQSIALSQGPLQRALRLASLSVHSTQGPVRPRADNLDVADAVQILGDQARRAREGRKRQTPEQWMAAVGLHDE
jgi:putative membrane protein